MRVLDFLLPHGVSAFGTNSIHEGHPTAVGKRAPYSRQDPYIGVPRALLRLKEISRIAILPSVEFTGNSVANTTLVS
jgi:hypothetical protein